MMAKASANVYGETINGKDKPLITIITVVYNAAKVLEATILSVINQSYPNIEYIVIDGASTDGTQAIISKYHDDITCWISEPDNGVYDAMNKGIATAHGDWVYFLGAGDTLSPILHMLAEKLTDPNYIYYGDVYRTDLQRLYDGKFSAFKLAVNNICHQAIFYPLAALKKYNYNAKYRIQADHNLNMQLYGDRGFKFKYLPMVIAVYEGAGISEQQMDKPFFKDKMAIIRSNFPTVVFWYAVLRRALGKIIKKTDYTS